MPPLSGEAIGVTSEQKRREWGVVGPAVSQEDRAESILDPSQTWTFKDMVKVKWGCWGP